MHPDFTNSSCNCLDARHCLRDVPASDFSLPDGLAVRGSSLLGLLATLNAGSADPDRKDLRMVFATPLSAARSVGRTDAHAMPYAEEYAKIPCRSRQCPLLPAAKGNVSHGSVLSENSATVRVISGWKTTWQAAQQCRCVGVIARLACGDRAACRATWERKAAPTPSALPSTRKGCSSVSRLPLAESRKRMLDGTLAKAGWVRSELGQDIQKHPFVIRSQIGKII